MIRGAKNQAQTEYFSNKSTAEQVRLAMPFARDYIEMGINFGARIETTFNQDVGRFLNDEELSDTKRFYQNHTEAQGGVLADRLEAARAIGIAIGLMLRPEAFGLKGGR
jgi:hypothetical protein